MKLNLKGYYIAVNLRHRYPVIAHCSLSGTKKGCIEGLIDRGTYTWDKLQEFGWEVVKVDAIFNPLYKKHQTL